MRILNNTAIAEANGEERAFGPLPVIEMEMVNVDELGWDPRCNTIDIPLLVPALFKDFFTGSGFDNYNYDAVITLPFSIPSGSYYIKNVNDDNSNLLYNVMNIAHMSQDGNTVVHLTLAEVTSSMQALYFSGPQNPDGSITLYSD